MFAIRQQFENFMHTWFKRRAPVSREIVLNLRNVYIFFSKEGVMYAFLIMITFVAGVNYANNLVLGLCFLLGSLLVITTHYTFAHLAGLHIKLVDISDAQVGGRVQVRLQVSSESSQPHRQIRFSFAKNAFDFKQPLQAKSDYVNEQADWLLVSQIQAPQLISLWLPVDKRGRFVLPRLTVSTVYPLGILQAWSYVFFDGYAWVYPAPLSYEMKANQFVLSDNEQTTAIHSRSGQEDFDQLDSYIVGESLARISWAHVARGQGLMSKRFVESVGQQQLLDYYQMPAMTHEEKLSQLRFGVDSLTQSQIAFQLRLPDGEGGLGEGQEFRQQCLLRLAKTP